MNMEVSWQKELANLVDTAKSPEEKIALNAFANALSPFMDRPDLLRTLLGKIQHYLPAGSVNIITNDAKFENMADLRKQVGEDVNVIAL